MRNGPCSHSVGSVACLKTSTNNSEELNIHRSYGLDSQYTEGFLVYMPSAVLMSDVNLLNLAKSCNDYDHFTISTHGTEIVRASLYQLSS